MPAELPLPGPNPSNLSRATRAWRAGENGLMVVVLACIVGLPLIEACLRKVFGWGISGATTIVQHCVLVASILGGALAAREARLLSLSTFTTFLKGRWLILATAISSLVAVTITVLLGLASYQFAMSTREAGRILVYGVPVWVVQLCLPIGFAVIAWRLWWKAGSGWKTKATVLGFTILLLILGIKPPVDPSHLVLPALGLLLIATLLGAPIFTVLGGAAMILFWGQQSPIASLAIDHYRLTVNASLPTIPLFTLAGYFLAEGGASRRLIRVFQAWVGHLHGGLAILTALVCAFFTSFTGASGVTILALGGLLMPVLLASRYTERNALGLLTGAGSLGLLFPPCLPLILYAIVATNAGATVTLEQIFLGGLLPGILLLLLTALWGIVQEPKAEGPRPRFDGRAAGAAMWEAKWELLLPVVALVALFGGFATPVEAAALTALYAFFVETVLYRDLRLSRDVPRVMTECGLLVGGVLLILGVAMGFTNYLVDVQVPDQAVEWVQQTIHNRWLFLLALNCFLLMVGCLMDIYSAIIVVVPLIVPIGLAFGIHPVHLGIVFLANMELGYLTPPVGMNLFLASYRFGKPIFEVARAVLPMLLVLLVGVLLITYLPWLSTALPNWLASRPGR